MMGSGDLGMGISLVLFDEFSEPARRVVQGFAGIEGGLARVAAKQALLNQFSNGLNRARDMLDRFIDSGGNFDQSLNELSSLTGVVGPGLDDIGKRALGLSKRFGADAAQGVNTFQNILGKLGPEIAQNSTALQAMGEDAFILSKGMKGDLAGATAALTTSMNIYAGSITDPLEMSREMTRQMNVMAAGAKVGSAEVTDIAASIRTGGLAAKSAGVSFEELNSLIQIMGRGAVYGSEAGVAIRNVLGIMSQGEYLPKKALAGLRAAGVDLNLIGDQSKPIAERLAEIAKIQNDSALVTEVFGRENSNAFRVLAENLGLMNGPNGWVAAMTGTHEATDQAAVVMSSFNEKMARGRATIQAWAVQAFMATKSILPFVKGTAELGVAVLSLGPAYIGATEALAAFKASELGVYIANVGLAATFDLLAVGVWAALAPLLPFIAIAAGLVAVIWLAWKGVKSFQDLMAGGKVEGGFWGVLQQIGGVVVGIVEAFQTWDGATFSFSERMRASLEKIGVLDLTLRLATWFIRIKEFMQGLWQGLKEAGSWIAQAFGAAWAYIGPLLTDLGEWGLTIKKLIGDTLDWHIAGQALGQTLGLVAKVVGGVLLAVLFLVGLAIAAVVKIISVAIDIIEHFVMGIMVLADWLGRIPSLVSDAFSSVYEFGQSIGEWLVGLPDAFFSFGYNMVMAIQTGLQNAWPMLKTMLLQLLHELPFGDSIMGMLGIGGGGGSLAMSTPAGGNSPQRIRSAIEQRQGLAADNRPTVLQSTTEKQISNKTSIYLDGREITATVKEHQQEEHDRSDDY